MADWHAIRSRFHLPEEGCYLDGNSLGLLCDSAERELLRVLGEWRTLGIRGWPQERLDGSPTWLDMSREVGRLYANLVGTSPKTVIAHGSTTLMLHQFLSTLYTPDSDRNRIVVDALAFPTDAYAVASHLRLHGLDVSKCLLKVESRDGYLLDEADLVDAIRAPNVSMTILPAVVFGSGQWLDLPRLCDAAKEAGVMIGLDCSHSIGCVPHHLATLGADFAFWCGYKHTNGGPGCVAGGYLHPRYMQRQPGLAGWFGSSPDSMFQMNFEQTPAPDAGRLQLGTPHILSLAPLLGSLRLVNDVGIDTIRERSLELTDHLIRRLDDQLASLGFELVTPREPERRGGHLSIRHKKARQLVDGLMNEGIVIDFRHPDVLRVAPVALYNTFEEVDLFVERVAKFCQDK